VVEAAPAQDVAASEEETEPQATGVLEAIGAARGRLVRALPVHFHVDVEPIRRIERFSNGLELLSCRRPAGRAVTLDQDELRRLIRAPDQGVVGPYQMTLRRETLVGMCNIGCIHTEVLTFEGTPHGVSRVLLMFEGASQRAGGSTGVYEEYVDPFGACVSGEGEVTVYGNLKVSTLSLTQDGHVDVVLAVDFMR
jgi:hypothetical protein